MSGTSLDGVDAALIRTDGAHFVEPLGSVSLPYDPDMRDDLRSCLNKEEDLDGHIARVERDITLFHADVVRELMADTNASLEQVDVIGFHGQTIAHAPERKFTWQIGDGALLAQEIGVRVVNDLRQADVQAGGQGAPLLPIYHRVRAENIPKPLVVLNLGGVANVTYIGTNEEEMLAFDTGPASALIDDFVKSRIGKSFDRDGELARSGSIHQNILGELLNNPYFKQVPPKSLDRNAWDVKVIKTLSDRDGAATLTAFTVWSILQAVAFFPAPAKRWIVTGGGRKNAFMMDLLRQVLEVEVETVETVGWNGDTLEAEGFAYMAVRSLLGLPYTFPGTTGVYRPLTGGVVHTP